MKNAGLYGWEWWGDWSFSPSSHRHIKYHWTSFAVHILQPSRNAFYGMICKTCICCKHILPPEQWRSMKNRSPFFLWVNEIACWVRIFFELLLCYWPLLFELASSHKLHKICMIAFFGRRQHGADHCFIRMFAYVPTMCSFHLAEILRHFFFVSLTIEIRVYDWISVRIWLWIVVRNAWIFEFDHHRCSIRSFIRLIFAFCSKGV